ncbi:uncharacterized protein LOC131683154 [Topomyia yanbarensis]|uniref:uncharacterized protein LOC131683154 n=1 Tax=Topomyia yanbarensis TaxID=2498891 RepID=UPI00273C6AED|nr:uncharacterized protein LOC131683154 [Topomyia yanbarensis]
METSFNYRERIRSKPNAYFYLTSEFPGFYQYSGSLILKEFEMMFPAQNDNPSFESIAPQILMLNDHFNEVASNEIRCLMKLRTQLTNQGQSTTAEWGLSSLENHICDIVRWKKTQEECIESFVENIDVDHPIVFCIGFVLYRPR